MLNVTTAIIGIAIIISILELLRRGYLREKYAFVWLLLGFIIVVGLFFPDSFQKISRLLGFEVYSNFVLTSFAVVLILFVMQLSLEISKLEDNSQKLAEEIALLKNIVENQNESNF